MDKTKKKIIQVIFRYFLAISATFALPLFYLIFSPLTIYPVFLITNLLYKSSLQGTILLINSYSVEFIDACIAGSAYLLLFLLTLLIPMNLKKRMRLLLLDFSLLLIFNISRLIILIILLINNFTIDFTHKLFWYAINTVFVALIWFLNIKIFRIKEIPVYSDIKFILQKK